MTVDATRMLERLAVTIPKDLHPHLLVVGSVAAAYHYRALLAAPAVRTKDTDLVVRPADALEQCAETALRLIAAGWRRTERCKPSPATVPADELEAIRLYPPESTDFFIELLGLPAEDQEEAKRFARLSLSDGDYGVPSFRFMALLESDKRGSTSGIQYASPPLMALANLLAHPQLSEEPMSGDIGGRRKLRRCAKDIGRAMPLAYLEQEVEAWTPVWRTALKTHFPAEPRELASRCGDGLRALVADASVLEEAQWITNVGLLGGLNVSQERLKIAGERILQLVVPDLLDAWA